VPVANDLVEKGIAAYARGSRDEAERLWREALALDPSSDRARQYLKQLREARASGPGVPPRDPAVSPRDPSPQAEPQDPARFSVPPERMSAFHRSGSSPGARKRALLAATATAIVVALAWGLAAAPSGLGARSIAALRRAEAAAAAALSALSEHANGLLARWRKAPGPKPVVASAPVTVPAPRPEPRGGGSGGQRAAAPAPSGGPAVGAAPAHVTVRTAEMGTRWGMTLGELLTAVPSASRVAHPRRYEGLLVQATVDRVDLAAHACRADFMFDPEGRLAEIQLRAVPVTHGEGVYDGLRASLSAELGEPTVDQRDPAGKGKWTARASWVTSRAAVDLEVRRLGASEAAMFQVDVRGGDLQPLYDSVVVLTLVSPDDPRSLANTGP
jgi:hypothetical protein